MPGVGKVVKRMGRLLLRTAKAVGGPGERGVYARPRHVRALEDCWFYHTIDLPRYGTQTGQWDLRNGVEDYLGHVDVRGKRVLEMGTATGMLCFAMEGRGAEVVAFDLAPNTPWDLVPVASCPDLGHCFRYKAGELERLRNSYWFSHRVLGSGSRVVYGSVYAVPAEIGPVDVCTFGSILLHLRDPFLALANGSRLTRETVIVTDLLAAHYAAKGPDAPDFPEVLFMPGPQHPLYLDTWWSLSPAAVRRFLAVLGFEDSTVSYHRQPYTGQPLPMFTVVARRTRPMPARVSGPFPWY
jgi:hypothetical protein